MCREISLARRPKPKEPEAREPTAELPRSTPILPVKGFPNLTLHPKADLIGRIITAVTIEFDLWMQANPDKAGDDRNRKALEESIKGLGTVFDIIDDYEIQHRTDVIPTGVGGSIDEVLDILKQR
jgi:hypothetical protein